MLATSRSTDFAEWAQVRVPAGTALRATVTVRSRWSAFSPSGRYRLVVVGSTRHLSTTDVTGAHQLTW